MGDWITLPTSHGPVQAWHAIPNGSPRGAVIVVQEIFGANAHIRAVAERLADAGFVALAPSMFDPVQPDADFAYDDAGMTRGRTLAGELGFDAAVEILRAAQHFLTGDGHHCAVIGFCWGGSVALLGNTRLAMPGVAYYVARSVPFLGEPLQAPMLFHFGADDPLVPAEDIQHHRAAYPQADVFVYEGAGHAFNRDIDPHHFHPEAARLAWRRTLDFLQANLA